MPDREYVIKVTTTADLNAAQATKAVMDAIAGSTVTVTEGADRATAATGRFTDSAGKLREANGRFVELGNSAQEAGKHLGEASHEADHFLESLQAGMTIDIGHRIVEGIAEIPAAFREAIAEGVHFDAEMEKLSISLAGSMRSANPAEYLTFSQAKEAGVDALEKLRAKANELGLELHSLVEGYSINVPTMAEAGVKDVDKQIELMTLMNQVASSKGLSGNQALKDIIDLLNGRGNRTMFGKELEPLGINDETIKQARETGTLYELLTSKLGAYGEAGRAAADTLSGAQQRLKNETEQLYGEIARPVFEEMKEQVHLLTEELSKPEGREALKALGYDIATVVEAGGGLIRFAVEHADVLVPLAAGIGAVTLALTAYKTAQLASIVSAKLLNVVAETAATEAHAAAVAADTAAVEANTVARAAGGGAGIGLNAATGGVVALGLLPGAGIYAARQHAADQEGERDQEVGEESSAHTAQAGKYYQDIERATTEEEKLKLRKSLTDDLASSQAKLADLKEKETAAEEDSAQNATGVSTLYDPKRADQIEALKEYVSELDKIIERFGRLAGSKPLPDLDAKKEGEALDRYKASPEFRLAQAEAAGDQDAIDDAKYDAQVDKKRAHLEKTYGLKPEEAERQAQEEVSADDQKKQDDADAKEAAREDKTAQREEEKARREADRAAKKSAQDAQKATAEAKQREDAISSEQEQIAITTARANGENDVADKLEKQRDIRLEITRLQGQGVGYAEAQSLAEEKVNAQNAAQDKKDADRVGKHPGGSHPEGWFITEGYRDPDKAGGLHGGSLDGHARSTDRFADIPDAAATALGAAPTAADALASAPWHVSSFPTATAAFSPLARALAGDRPDDVPPTDDGNPPGGGVAAKVTPAADDSSSALRELTSAAKAAAAVLNAIKPPAGGGSGGGGGTGGGFDDDDGYSGMLDNLNEGG